MFVDPEVFADLEFFHCRNLPGRPVFAYIDACRTESGREYLKELLKNSPKDAERICELQTITRFFFTHQDEISFDVADHMLRGLEEYLHSNFIGIDLSGVFAPFLQALYQRYWYPEVFVFARNGIEQILRVVSLVSRFIAALQQRGEIPPPVKELFDEFFRICAQIDVEELSQRFHQPSALDVFSIDFWLRVQNKEKIQALQAVIARMDAHLGMAQATRENGFVFPEIKNALPTKVRLAGLYHPFLPNPVKNDFHLEAGKNVLFLTGPNMAGKTTFLKALGISLILAHIGMGVPAQSMEFTPMTHLFFQLTVQDNLRLGISSFFQEVTQVKRITELLREGLPVMIIIDEIFKGTNVSDAFECSKAVINGFAGFRNPLFIVSSHLYELESAISGNPNLRFQFFDSKLDGGSLRFSHQLRDGVSQMRVGIKLLQDAGIVSFFSKHPPEESEPA
jgi:DNA mismatch repair ATPase MutS